MIFEFDIDRWIRLVISPRLRKPLQLKWLSTLVFGIREVYKKFIKNRKANLYALSITPQVCYLEKLLNDRYDLSDRRISIGDGKDFDPAYIFTKPEAKEVGLFLRVENKPIYLRTRSETAAESTDFVVYVPLELTFNLEEMKVLLNNYKLSGKRYEIKSV